MVKFVLIFDLDMTLVDISIVNFDRILIKTIEKVNAIVPSESERNKLWRSGKEHVNILKSWGVRDIYLFWKTFDELDHATRKRYIDSGKIKVFPDAKVLLNKLEKREDIIMALHTNTPKDLAMLELDVFKLEHYFKFILALNMNGNIQENAKPEPWGVFYLIKKMKKEYGIQDLIKRAIFIGDSDIDMLTAKRAAIPGIQILRRKKDQSNNAFRVIQDLQELSISFLEKCLANYHQDGNEN
ncbi:MAG: HAD family hydrolase [Promethearchaeota archaeon]